MGYRLLTEDSNIRGLWRAPAAAWESEPAQKIRGLNKRWIILLVSIVLALVILVSYHPLTITNALSSTTSPSTTSPSAPLVWPSAVLVDGTPILKPRDFKIIGILFFGRRDTLSVLECYLRANLVSYGGFLDEIHFVVNTGNEDDIAWLANMVVQVKDYKRVELKEDGFTQNFNSIYAQSIERDHMYIKIDDDLVWMSPTAIPELVNTKLNHPESFAVLASLINSATMGWVQYRLGAVHSYFPERQPPILEPSSEDTGDESYGPKAWRASALPTWQSPNGDDEIEEFPHADKAGKADKAPIGSIGGAPYANHRWLPLRDEDRYIAKTPIAEAEYQGDGNSWHMWTIAAQQHYSLLENLEKGLLRKYHIGDEGIWNMRYDRTNINLFAIWANDILDNLPFEGADDEQLISSDLPRKQHRQNLVQTRALTAHFSFAVQKEMYDTDLLSRYRAYANEMVCTAENQIPIVNLASEEKDQETRWR